MGREGQDGVVQCEIEEKETLRKKIKRNCTFVQVIGINPTIH